MRRHQFEHDGLRLSFLDEGGSGRPLIALHAHWMEGITYKPLADALSPAWRVIAPDQRGHGHSDHAATYARADYLGDLEALYAHLGLDRAVLLGNSLGGVNAWQFAARRKQRVTAMIIEDIGAEIADDTAFTSAWRGTFATKKALETRIGPRLLPYLAPSFRQVPDGWTLAFDPADTEASQRALNGEYWEDWLASFCPALLIRGRDSPVTKREMLAQMAARRPDTRLVTMGGGHIVHVDNAIGFATAVQAFLDDVGEGG